jgi:hypothetical protein
MTSRCATPFIQQREEDKETLEGMVDGMGLRAVLLLLQRIAYGKAQHIEENWQDTTLADDWKMAGNKIGRLAESKLPH